MATNMNIRFEEPAVGNGPIEILSWNHGFSRPTSPTRSTAGSGAVEQAIHNDLTFSKYLDASSTELMRRCWTGQQTGKVTISCFRSDGAADNKPYLEIVMQHVIVSNVSISGGPGNVPVENISLDYGVIDYRYRDKAVNDGMSMEKPTRHIV